MSTGQSIVVGEKVTRTPRRLSAGTPETLTQFLAACDAYCDRTATPEWRLSSELFGSATRLASLRLPRANPGVRTLARALEDLQRLDAEADAASRSAARD